MNLKNINQLTEKYGSSVVEKAAVRRFVEKNKISIKNNTIRSYAVEINK